MLQRMMELYLSIISLGGFEISESIYVEGMMMGLKFTIKTQRSKYAFLQIENLPGDGKIVVISYK